jgi:multidrug efflux system membrane fusion protein
MRWNARLRTVRGMSTGNTLCWSGGRLAIASAASLLGAAFLIGCEKPAQAIAVPPAEMSVAQPIQQTVTDSAEFPGNTAAFASVDVRARVKGFLKKIDFAEGENVKAGELLFEIEPDIFQAEVDSAKANLQGADARLAKAKADLSIKKEMAAGNAASKLDVIQAEANVHTAEADVAAGKASLEQATINLNYTKIYAPIAGRIDKSRIDAGNLVGADGNTLLTNIVQADPIYVYFYVDEPTIQKFMARTSKSGVTPGTTRPTLPLQMALGASSTFSYSGQIDFVDNQVDSATGTIRVRGVLPNADRLITPGFFSRVRVPDGEPYAAVLVPERAIGVDQGQKFVLVVNDKNVVESRPIETGSQQGRMRVVKKGLKPDDWFITDGILRTRPGATIAPQKKSLAEPATTQATTQQTAQAN